MMLRYREHGTMVYLYGQRRTFGESFLIMLLGFYSGDGTSPPREGGNIVGRRMSGANLV